jgi:VWFA-related protein
VRTLRVALVALVLVYAVPAALAPGRLSAQVPSFRAGVEVVVIDVSVVDRSAFPVTDLTPADFTVTVDGKPRKIMSAQFLSHRAPGIDEILRVERGEPQPEVIAPGRVGTGRDIIIAVDEDSLGAGDGALAKRAIGRFLDQLLPTDRVAVVTLPRLPARIGLTTNRRDLFNALALVSPAVVPWPRTDYHVGLSEAYDITRRDAMAANEVVQRECIAKLTTQATRTDQNENREIEACRANVLIQAYQMALVGHDRAQRSLDALRRLAGLLSSVPRPKTLVLVSGGFPPPVSTSEFSSVALELAAAQVNLYSLYLEKFQVENAAAQPSPTATADESLVRDGIENMTASAGGTLLLVTGEFEPLLDRVSRELAGSYLLGVEVETADRDGHPHRVDVHVNRDGLSIRARKQYVIGPASGSPEPAAAPPEAAAAAPNEPKRSGPAAGFSELSYNRILTAARDLEGAGDIYVTMKVGVVEASGPFGREVLVEARINPRSVSFTPLDGRRVAHLGIGIFCGDAKHAVVGQLWQDVNFALKDDTFAKYTGEGIPYTARVAVTGDPRDVKIVVYDFRSDLLGAMTAKIK